MNEHHRWVRFAVLGLAYALLGVVLVVQEVAGPLALSWGIVLPGLLVLIGLLIVATTIVGNRRRVMPDWRTSAFGAITVRHRHHRHQLRGSCR